LDWFYEHGYLKKKPAPRPAPESANPGVNK
jgi:hypothetical protein